MEVLLFLIACGLVAIMGLLWQLLNIQKQNANLLNTTIAQQVSEGLHPMLENVTQSASYMEKSQTELSQTFRRIEEVNGALNDSHQYLQSTIELLAKPGSFDEMVSTLNDVLKPLEQVGPSIGQHYETNAQLLARMMELTNHWSAHGDRVTESSQKIATALDQWAASESAGHQEITKQIIHSFREIGEQHKMATQNSKELREEVTELTKAMNRLKGAVDSIDQWAKTQERVAKDQQRLLEVIQLMADELKNRQQLLGEVEERYKEVMEHQVRMYNQRGWFIRLPF